MVKNKKCMLQIRGKGREGLGRAERNEIQDDKGCHVHAVRRHKKEGRGELEMADREMQEDEHEVLSKITYNVVG